MLFSNRVPLDIAFSLSIRSIRNSADSVYIKEMMTYRTEEGSTDSIKVGFKRRGNFRLNECSFPPLWIRIDKKQNKHTLFEDHKKLKLVMPCDGARGSNDLILREYLCYRLYEVMTPFCFRTRLVNIDFTDDKGKKNKEYQLKGILVEDIDKVVKRTSAKSTSAARINRTSLNDTCALRFDLFQLLIANTDWSKASQHNSKLVLHNGKYIALCDQDDYWLPQKIEMLVNNLGNADLIYHNSLFVDEKNNSLIKTVMTRFNPYSGNTAKIFLMSNCVSGHACLFRRDLLVFGENGA